MKLTVKILCLLTFALLFTNAFAQNIKSLNIDEKAKLLTEKLDQFLDLSTQQETKIEQIYYQYLNDFYYILNKENTSNSIIVAREKAIENRLQDYIKRTLSKSQRAKYLMLLNYMKE